MRLHLMRIHPDVMSTGMHRTLPLVRLNPDTPLKVHGIMRLAVKYQMDVVRTIIARHIEADWPSTLAEYERCYVEMRKLILSEPPEDPTKAKYDYALFPEPASAIRFTMEFDCPSILPAAFYELARGGELLKWDTTKLNRFDSRPARWQLLQSGDLLRLLRGKQYLLRQWGAITDKLKESVKAGCKDAPDDPHDHYRRPTMCEDFIDRLLREEFAYPHNTDPLDAFCVMDEYVTSSLLGMHNRGYWCCDGGELGMRRGMRQEAKKIWDSLPEAFDLKDLLERDLMVR